MGADWRAGDDAQGLAAELEERALAHEKVLQHLDLRTARALRDLARRIRDVAGRAARGEGDPQEHHLELLKLRLEAMSALLSDLGTAPRTAPPRSAPVPRSDVRESDTSLAAIVARRKAGG
jgi:hypothetical protein